MTVKKVTVAGRRTQTARVLKARLPVAVTLDDVDITAWKPQRRGKAGLARTFQHGHAFRELTVRENVEVAALGVGAAPAEARRRCDALVDLLGIAHHQHGLGLHAPYLRRS